MKKFKTALVIGRFQPFHLGHLYLINKSLEIADKIIIAIGSSNISNENNPLNFETRRKMLEKVIAEEKLSNKVIKIIPSPDNPSDNVWLKLLIQQTGPFDIAPGNNSWNNGILKAAGYKVMEIPYLKREDYQGVNIRRLFQTKGNWRQDVPTYLVDLIEKELL